MKEYHKILAEIDQRQYRLIEQQWGQNASNVYNQICEVWNILPVGGRVFVLSRKKYGLKTIVNFLKQHGLNPTVEGKGPEDVRMLEMIKTDEMPLERDDAQHFLDFQFENREYHVNIGNAVFSKTSLDEGTQFLLETFLHEKPDLGSVCIADLGAGWGAISLILSSTFPLSQIVAFENEPGAFAALGQNVKNFKNIEIKKTDVTQSQDPDIRLYKGAIDYIVCNFSFHITTEERKLFFKTVSSLLKPSGEIFFVTEGRFVEMFEKNAIESLHILESYEHKRYKVFRCKK